MKIRDAALKAAEITSTALQRLPPEERETRIAAFEAAARDKVRIVWVVESTDGRYCWGVFFGRHAARQTVRALNEGLARNPARPRYLVRRARLEVERG